MDIETQPEPPAGWEALARERGLFYHHPRWIAGLRDVFGFRVHFVVAREAGDVVGGLPLAEVPALFGPRRLVSLPFSYAAGPMAASPDVAQALGAESIALARRRRVKRVEVKQVASEGEHAAPAGFTRIVHYHTYRLATAGGEGAIWKRLHASSTQRGIRKAEKMGVTVVRGDSVRDWTEMAVLQEHTSHGHGVPAPPRRFFVELCRALQRDGLAELYLADVPQRGIAAGIVVWRGWREWIYAFGASREALLEFRPNHALLWAAVRAAAAAGVDFDFGRAAPEQAGLVALSKTHHRA
ncbi:MAG: GNAT family N-acetyltransferase, partial [Gemmatimonadaceae bacterium]|nr:GNAT family N-acetyltransferase [Gemmatimonadaceae bacterium]